MPTKWEINMAVRTSGLPAPSRLIILTLSDLADAKTGIVPDDRTPSLRELTEWTGLDKSTVTRHLDSLDASGWVKRNRPDLATARREHARTSYVLDMPHGAESTMPEGSNQTGMVHSASSQDGQDGHGMVHSAPRHGAESTKGMVHSASVPYTNEVETIEDHSSSPKTAPPKRRRSKPKTADRVDVEKICNHLADKIAADGTKRPTITAKWRTEARLLIDTDGRTVEQVIKAIDWCQADPFWRGNILSMPKLRKQYETLRRHAQRPNGRASPHQLIEHNGLMLKPETIADLERSRRFEALDAADQQQIAIEGPR